MKIVINATHGGFGLSIEAMKRAIAEGASGVVVHDEEEYTGGCNWVKWPADAGDGYKAGSISDVLYKDGSVYTFRDNSDEHRADPVLIRIVEEMGRKANGHFADLRVVEIPDDVEWEIQSYDGDEQVVDVSRVWR